MTNESPERQSDRSIAEKAAMARKLGGIGWGLFFLWIGAAALMHVSWAVTLLGVGVITLAVQALRIRFSLAPEGFWVVFGALFLLGGFWELFSVGVSLLPILFLIAGAALLVSVTTQSHRMKEQHHPR